MEHIVLTGGDDLDDWQLYELINLGNFQRASEILEEKPEYFFNLAADFLWFSWQKSIEFRQHPKFTALLQRHGIADLWQHL